MNKTFKKEDGVLIAEGKSAINYYDFRGCKELKTVVIPESVVIINEPVVKVRTGWHHTEEAKRKIIDLSGRIDPEDMIRIDEIIQEQM